MTILIINRNANYSVICNTILIFSPLGGEYKKVLKEINSF